jgi:hypothetical protein
VNSHYLIAILISIPMIGGGAFSAWQQTRGLRALYARKLVPSDEYAYLRGKYRRRFVVGILLVIIGVMLGGAFVSGMEAIADRMAAKQPTDGEGKRPEMTSEQKYFLKWYGGYWSLVIVLVFGMLFLALADGLATRRYWLAVYRQLRDEHNTQMRRDIAVLKAQHDQRGHNPGYGGRLGDANPSES